MKNFLNTALFFLFASSAFASSEILHLGKVTVHIQEKKIEGYPELFIDFDHYGETDEPNYSSWYKSRSQNPGDRLGSREFWLIDLPEETQESYPEANKNGLMQIHLSANPKAENTNAEWYKIFNTPNPEVHFALFQIAGRFYLKNKKNLNALDNKNNGGISNFKILWSMDQSQGRPDVEKAFVDSVISGTYSSGFTKQRYITEIPNQPMLIVTHASDLFDIKRSAKYGLESVVKKFKDGHLPVSYLVHNDEMRDFSWYLKDRAVTSILFSHGGEHSFLIKNPDVTLAGGYFSQCLRRTIQDTITRYFFANDSRAKDLHIHLPMAAIYTDEHDTPTLKKIYQTKTKDEFLNFIEQSLFWKKRDVTEDDSSEGDTDAIGDLDLNLYQIEISVDGNVISTHGKSNRVVKLLFSSA